MTVTNKRIFGKTAFGKRVDLPVDSVSAISTAVLLRGITVATSSGKIKFVLIKNCKEIYEMINNLLIERQENNRNSMREPSPALPIQVDDTADQLRKFKDLLDSGAITQEEYELKKKQILEL